MCCIKGFVCRYKRYKSICEAVLYVFLGVLHLYAEQAAGRKLHECSRRRRCRCVAIRQKEEQEKEEQQKEEEARKVSCRCTLVNACPTVSVRCLSIRSLSTNFGQPQREMPKQPQQQPKNG